MKTKLLLQFLSATVLTMLAGCTALQSEFYPGERVENLYEILPEQSIWMINEETVLQVQVVESNVLVIAGLEWEKKNKEFKAETLDVILSKIDDQYFASMKDEDSEYFVITRLIFSDTDADQPGSAIILNIDENKLLEDAKAGRLKLHESECCGKKKLETILVGTKEEQNEYFREHPNALWDLESVSILRRISIE